MAMARRGTIGWPIAIQIVTNFQPDTAAQAISNGQLYGQTCGAHLSFIVRFIHASSLLARSSFLSPSVSLSMCCSWRTRYVANFQQHSDPHWAAARLAVGSRQWGVSWMSLRRLYVVHVSGRGLYVGLIGFADANEESNF